MNLFWVLVIFWIVFFSGNDLTDFYDSYASFIKNDGT